MDKVNLQGSEIRYIFQTIKRRWYIVLIFIILAAGFSYYKGYYKTTTIYQAKTALIVGNPSGSDITQVQLLERFIETYCSMAKSNFIAEKASSEIKSRLNMDVSAETIESSIIAAPQPNTQFMNIEFTWKTPDETKKILSIFSEVFIAEVKKFYPTSNIQVMENIKEPRPIVISQRKYLILFPIGGLILAILVIFGIELFDNTIKTDEDVKEYLKGSVIGEIPKGKNMISNINSISLKSISNIMLEAYRTLRTNIEFITSCNNIKAIMVTSARPEEGKTLTTAMLATVLAQTGKKTILIDCDLRKPNIHRLFTVPNTVGLTSYLSGKATLTEIITNSTIDNLYIIAAGIEPPNPTELLSSAQMKMLMSILRNDYDYVIIDTPPVGLVTDAQVLSQITEGSIFVVSSGKSVKEDTVKSKELLRQVGGSIFGYVLNNIRHSGKYKKYSYYYKDRKREKMPRLAKS